MKLVRGTKLRPQQLVAYIEKEVTASDAAIIEAQLSNSSEARRQLQQLHAIRDVLASAESEGDNVELLALVRDRIRGSTAVESANLARPPRRWVRWYRPLLAAAAALGLVLAYVGRPLRVETPDASEFREKSASQGLPSGRWAGIQAYRVRAGNAERLGDSLARGDGLSFSYTNLGAAPFAHLMIFAVDASGEVRWFYPGYEREGTNPDSISIRKDAAELAFGELIQHDFAAGPLTIHALFTNRPLRVLEVEAWLKEDSRRNLAARAPGAVEQVLTTRVTP